MLSGILGGDGAPHCETVGLILQDRGNDTSTLRPGGAVHDDEAFGGHCQAVQFERVNQCVALNTVNKTQH